MNSTKIIAILGLSTSVLFVAVLYLLFLNFKSAQIPIATPTAIPTPTPTPTATPTPIISLAPTTIPTPKVSQVKILDTSSWVSHTCGSVSFKLPANYQQRCIDNNDGSYTMHYGQDDKIYTNSFIVSKYNGGSRRQYWINLMKVSQTDLVKYVRFQESQYGSVSGLDVFASGYWWQGGGYSAILIANNKTLVRFICNHNFNDELNQITRDQFADSIASTIKFIRSS